MVQYMQYLFARMEALSVREDEGQGMVEYGLIIALVAVVVAVALKTLGTNISTLLSGLKFS